jgi:plastocyanin
MKPLPSLLICLLSTTAFAGDITGTVRAEGKEGVPSQTEGGAKYDSRKFKFVERVDYSQLRDFVVYIDQPMAEKPKPPAKPLEVVTQKDATFKPHVLPIILGTTIDWPNQDDILHNVYSFSETKQFDLGLYKDEVKKVTFDKSGRVDVFCSIHSKMHCVILVLENPHFATTDAKGAFTITNVPAGTYKLKAWHERLPSQVKEITVPESGSVKADFVLGIKGLPQY